MLRPITAVCAILLFYVFFEAQCDIINIELVRQRSPRENLLLAKRHGYDIYHLENPKNATNYTLALKKYLDNEFYGIVRVGSRGKAFQVVFDTAWTTSWLMSRDCSPQVEGCRGHQLYDHDGSATYVKNGTAFNSNAGTFNFTGYYSTDKFNYGAMKIVNQSFVEMTYVPPSYQLSKADGVIGLSLSYGGERTLPALLYDLGLLKEPVFSVYLNRKDAQSPRGGDIMLGAINGKHIHVTNKVKDTITYVQVKEYYGLWAFDMDAVALVKNKTSIPICAHGCSAFIDLGSINIYASAKEVKAINDITRAFPDKKNPGKFALDCATIENLPPISFIIGGTNFTLHGNDYVHRVADGNQMTCFSVFMEPNGKSTEGSWVLGASFLARYFSVYNFGLSKIGFVTAA